MKDMTYYVVEVSFRSTNPIHRCICFHRANGNIQIWEVGYGEIFSTNITRLSFFNVVLEIPEMTTHDYDNCFKLPMDML